MTLSAAVVIATKNRSQEVSKLLDALALQSIPPVLIVVSACDRTDVDTSRISAKNVEVIFGSPGLTAQRNRALSLIRGKCDVVVFFDDDFIPSRFWIERIQVLFGDLPDVGTVTGRVLVDAVKTGGLPWSDGQSVVDKADSEVTGPTQKYDVQPNSPYGCNMAFRLKAIDGMLFDERLPLYGWLEDLDFGLRAGSRGRMISTNLVWGVHLGVKGGGRDHGLRFGYSQVVNPWYLMRKGIIERLDAFKRIGRGTAGNAVMAIYGKSHVDRWGRLRGNLIGLKDIITGKWNPEKITRI